MEQRMLVTGVGSGFGKYAYEVLGCFGLTRQTCPEVLEKLRENGVDYIIHCAFNSRRGIKVDQLYGYVQDNIILTTKLTRIPHKRIILLSSIDVYPGDGRVHEESEEISLDSVSGIYGVTKLMTEELIKRDSVSYLILRCSGLLGKYSRRNNLIKLLEEKNPELTLTADSELNLVLHKDLLDFIQLAIKQNLSGTYNIASAENICLLELAEKLQKKVKFGDYYYKAAKVNNKKTTSIFPVFNKGSMEVVLEFLEGDLKND